MSEAGEPDVFSPIEHYRIADRLLQDAAKLLSVDKQHARASFIAEAAVHVELAKCAQFFSDRDLRPWLSKVSTPKE